MTILIRRYQNGCLGMIASPAPSRYVYAVWALDAARVAGMGEIRDGRSVWSAIAAANRLAGEESRVDDWQVN